MNNLPTHLDDLDRRILDALQVDASLTNEALAAKVFASAPTCLRRVKRLSDTGVIEKQVAILAPALVGAGLTAIIEITLDAQGAEQQAQFAQRAASETAVTQCYQVSAGLDFILIAQVADMAAYQMLAQRLLAGAANVRNLRTFFSTQRVKFETRINVPND
jgi:Lrp/AsnC family leucine-responsive transcriptional regulator